jgi:hypothetical protein
MYLTTDASRLHKAMDEYHKFTIHECKEEPVSEDLEDAAEKYRWSIEEHCSINDNGTYNYSADDIENSIKTGFQLHKEQMMAKAIDVEVKVDAGGYPYIPQIELYDYDNDVPLAKEGDKYKVVLIKEE